MLYVSVWRNYMSGESQRAGRSYDLGFGSSAKILVNFVVGRGLPWEEASNKHRPSLTQYHDASKMLTSLRYKLLSDSNAQRQRGLPELPPPPVVKPKPQPAANATWVTAVLS
jgi:hypothetical protein